MTMGFGRFGVGRSGNQNATKQRSGGEQKKERTIGECVRHRRVQTRRRGCEDGPHRVTEKAKRSVQAVDWPATHRRHGLRQPSLLDRTEGASPSVATPAESSYQRGSAKKPRLHGHQRSDSGKGLRRLVDEQKGLSTATITERPREQGQH